MSKLLKFASKAIGKDVEYKFVPAGAEEATWDLLEKSTPQFDKEGNLTKGPIPRSNRSNLAYILENDSRFESLCYHDHADKMLYEGAPVEDQIIENVGIFLERIYHMKAQDKALKMALTRAAMNNIYDPIKDWLVALPAWDGEIRLENIFDEIYKANYDPSFNDLVKEMSRKWLITFVARIFEPGCEVHSALTLISTEKGVGKGLSLKALFGESWYSNSPLEIGTTRGYMALHQSGVWCWEIAEMASLQGKTAELSKAFFTGAWDRYTANYGYFPKHRPRRTCFVLSSNNIKILSDGAERRFWPIIIQGGQRVNIEIIKETRTQLFAEAKHRYEAGESWYLDPIQSKRLQEYQELFIIDDPWACKVKEAILNSPMGASTSQIMDKLELPIAQQHTGNSKRIAQICKELGFTQHRSRDGRTWKR